MKRRVFVAVRRPMAAALASSVALAALPAPLWAADDFNAWRQQQMRGAQAIQQEFQAFKEKQHAEFAQFLKSQWRDFETFQGKKRIKEPKPKAVPVAVTPPPAKPVAPPQPVRPVQPIQPVQPPPAPVAVVPPQPIVPPPAVQPIPQPVVPPAPQAIPAPKPAVPVPQALPAARPPQAVTPPVAVAPAPVVPVVPAVVPPPPQPKPVPVAADALELAFYGNAVVLPFDQKWKSYRLRGGAKPEAMSSFWALMSGSKYEPTLEAMAKTRRDLKLDDWAYVSLWRDAVAALQPSGKAEQNLLLWFFLVKSGFDVRLGYAGEQVHLFVASRQQVFSTKFITVGDVTYYAVLASDRGDSIGSFYTYEAKYPTRLNALDLGTASTGFTRTSEATRPLAFEFRGKTYKLNVPYDRRLVQYLNSYPQSEFSLYFGTDGSPLMRQALLAELKKQVAGMSEDDAANFLLAFVQKAFAYKTDEEQFGYEKYFFVEEALHYPFSDCEDRSVLYAWLMQQVLGVKTVGLLYPGHMTTAVALKQVKPGYATVDYQGRRYVIADPTYINASVGMPMPSYARLNPTRVVEAIGR